MVNNINNITILLVFCKPWSVERIQLSAANNQLIRIFDTKNTVQELCY